ncbi:metallophosphoesterase [Agathobaculum sp. LCP25S3_E8]|uniref:metallophosphoesterase n=1 Tax=Agathobaculum sp. LCP25S3_E8 TaxID=3438735 RepID=UPI003F8F0403
MDGKRLCPFVFMLEVVMDRRKRWIHAFVLCAIGIGIAGLQCGLVTRNYTLETEKLKEGQGMRLLMLSDLHSCIYGENQCQLMERIIREQPDCILLCGDIVDDKIPRDGAEQLLQQITQIAPCYYVSGNHEFWSGQAEDIFDMIEQYGVHVLRNDQETVTINEVSFILCGVDDPASTGTQQARSYGESEEYRRTLSQFQNLDEKQLCVLLAHRPEYITEYAKYPFDLVLCGHAHGGQWRIPYLLNGLIAPNQGFFPKYAGGQYTCGSMTEIVGRGLARDWKPRLFNPPEIVVVDLSGTGE